MFTKSAAALALLLLPFVVHAQDNNVTVVTNTLQKIKAIPDVIPNNTALRLPLEVVFNDGNATFAVTAGANLTTAQVQNLPLFALQSTNTQIIGKPYLMAIVDPDALTPQNPNISQFRHFLASDFISNASTNGEFVLFNKSNTSTLTDYVAPTPPANSAPHRYVVLCYLQDHVGVTPPPGFNASNRNNFNITEFVNTVKGNNFTLIAATEFFVGANFTNGSVTPNVTLPDGAPTSTSPSGSGGNGSGSGSGGSGNTSGAFGEHTNLASVVAWSFVAVLSASGALLL